VIRHRYERSGEPLESPDALGVGRSRHSPRPTPAASASPLSFHPAVRVPHVPLTPCPRLIVFLLRLGSSPRPRSFRWCYFDHTPRPPYQYKASGIRFAYRAPVYRTTPRQAHGSVPRYRAQHYTDRGVYRWYGRNRPARKRAKWCVVFKQKQQQRSYQSSG